MRSERPACNHQMVVVRSELHNNRECTHEGHRLYFASMMHSIHGSTLSTPSIATKFFFTAQMFGKTQGLVGLITCVTSYDIVYLLNSRDSAIHSQGICGLRKTKERTSSRPSAGLLQPKKSSALGSALCAGLGGTSPPYKGV
jgi:hypothetical protein